MGAAPAQPDEGSAGFTLIEVMISLGLFGLIAVAGLAMVGGILNVRGKTETRLDRLAELQRTMLVVTGDIDQVSAGKISGGGGDLAFTRAAPGAGGPALDLRYGVTGGALLRFLGPRPQLVLTGVASARWRFWDGAWRDHWPLDEEHQEDWPRAIELELALDAPGGPAGTLRRVVLLPARPEVPKVPGALP